MSQQQDNKHTNFGYEDKGETFTSQGAREVYWGFLRQGLCANLCKLSNGKIENTNHAGQNT